MNPPNPNELMLAENLAKHFFDTRFKIGLINSKRYPTWELISVKERQIYIQVFVAILKVAADEQLQENASRIDGKKLI